MRVDEINNSDTEQLLEDLLVASPDLLGEGVSVVGRQLQTAAGPLDLLGVDEDGRLVVFELKRGVLTREAVAQILDYASDLGNRELSEVAHLVEENSGRLGVERFKDFLDWYDAEYGADRESLERPPRMVLVGLGVDDRARRIVEYLAKSNVPIELLTFHAFRAGDELFLARQVEVATTTGGSTVTQPKSKEENKRILMETAKSHGVRDLLEETAALVSTRWPGYQWPGKTAYTFSLSERTAEGKPTFRSYIVIYVNLKESGSLLFQLTPRALEAAGEGVRTTWGNRPQAQLDKSVWVAMEVRITSQNLSELREPLVQLLNAIIEGWTKKAAPQRVE
jgi:hypothetical protein